MKRHVNHILTRVEWLVPYERVSTHAEHTVHTNCRGEHVVTFVASRRVLVQERFGRILREQLVCSVAARALLFYTSRHSVQLGHVHDQNGLAQGVRYPRRQLYGTLLAATSLVKAIVSAAGHQTHENLLGLRPRVLVAEEVEVRVDDARQVSWKVQKVPEVVGHWKVQIGHQRREKGKPASDEGYHHHEASHGCFVLASREAAATFLGLFMFRRIVSSQRVFWSNSLLLVRGLHVDDYLVGAAAVGAASPGPRVVVSGSLEHGKVQEHDTGERNYESRR